VYVWCNIEAHSCKHCYSGKAICITYSKCVFLASDFQHTMRMRRSALQYFYTLSHKWRGFRKKEKKLLNIKCMFWFSLNLWSETFSSLWAERWTIINVHWSSCKMPFILVIFYSKLNFLDRFSKNTQISNIMWMRSAGAELFRADEQRDGQTWRS